MNCSLWFLDKFGKNAIGKLKKVNIVIGPTNKQVPFFQLDEYEVCNKDPLYGSMSNMILSGMNIKLSFMMKRILKMRKILLFI